MKHKRLMNVVNDSGTLQLFSSGSIVTSAGEEVGSFTVNKEQAMELVLALRKLYEEKPTWVKNYKKKK